MEHLVIGIIPTAIVIIALASSLFFAIRTHSNFQVLAAGVATTVSIWSLKGLYSIFVDRAWPTILPHIAIGGVVILVLLQFSLFLLTREGDHRRKRWSGDRLGSA